MPLPEVNSGLRQTIKGHSGKPNDVMDNLRRFPAPWVMVEEGQCFRVKDANGFSVCSVPHREDLHQRP